jgi:hypothetical protein
MSVVRATTGTRVNAAGLVELVPYNLLTWSEQFDDASWNKLAINISANSTISPTGITNADTIAADGSASIHRILSNNFSTVAGTTYTASIYAKKNTNNFFQIYLNSFLTTTFANFDLNNGTLGTVGSTATAQIENVGNGWFRCSITTTQSTSSLSNAAFSIITSASSPRVEVNTLSTSVFLWGAQLVEGSEPLDYLPTTDRLDIARIDYSTGEAALLVEPQRTNLVTYSEQFDNAAWNKQNSSVTANTTISPDGLQDADKLVENTALGQHALLISGAWSTTQQTASIYVKSAERTKLYIGNNSLGVGIFFDLTTGTIEGILGAITGTISSVENGWYRVTATHTATASQTLLIGTYITYTGVYSTTRDYTGNGTSGIFLWGAQLEAGNYSTSYIPTTSASVTRNRDVISSTIPSILNASSGTLFVDAFPVVTSAFNQTIASINDGTNSRGFWLVLDNGVLQVGFRNAGGIFAANSSFSITNLQRIKIALTWNGSAITLFANGVKRIDNLSLGADYPSTINTIQMQGDGSFFAINRNFINSMALYPIPLSDTELINLTTI